MHTVYEGFEEYSCKLFASRRENMPVGSSASKEGEGPMVSTHRSILVCLVTTRESLEGFFSSC